MYTREQIVNLSKELQYTDKRKVDVLLKWADDIRDTLDTVPDELVPNAKLLYRIVL